MDEISIEKARARLGDYVSDAQSGTPVLITRSGKAAAMLVPLTRLTETDLRLIARAREMEGLSAGDNTVQEHTGEADPALAYVRAFGQVLPLLGWLADALERLGAPEGGRP